MNCPNCGTAALNNAKQCPVCGTALPSSDADETLVGNATPAAVTSKSTADDETAAGFTAPPIPRVAAHVLMPPPSSGSSDGTTFVGTTSSVDFGPRYRVVRLLGQGGMGAVYLAYDQDLGRQVALKLVKPELMVYPGAMDRFRQELLLASKISHRNILRIHDLGDAGGMKFISMAYVDGEDLHLLLVHEGKLPLDRMIKLARQLCAALDAAHSEGVAHRDLKPQNIMLDKDDHVFVTDFGLAKSLGEVNGMTQSGEMLGTPRYMAPEQVEAKHVDARTDIYALGLIFYEMLTGDVPFTAETTLQLMYKRANETPPAPKTINPDIPDWLNNIVMKCLERDPSNRYQSAHEIVADIDAQRKPPASQVAASAVAAPSEQAPLAVVHSKSRRYLWIAAAVVLTIGVAIGGWFYFKRSARTLTDKDTIVLMDFANSTGDPVFDEALQQGLAVQLEQSPFLSLVSEQRIRQAMQLMGQSPDARITHEMARELCQRVEGAAVVGGSIAMLGSQYVLALQAVNCRTGDILGREQITAEDKSHVLSILGTAVTSLRGKLGESLTTVQKYDTPLEQATTHSLDALQAYSQGRKMLVVKGDYLAAVPLFQRALEVDPNFAMAYASLGTAYHNLGEKNLAAENTKKSFELRERVSERERYYIESHYYHFVIGNLDEARKVYELWAQTYPREVVPPANLGVLYQNLGQYDKALEEFREALRLVPDDALTYSNLAISYICLDRLKEAGATAEEAQAKNFDSADLRLYLYELGFLQHDAARMEQQVTWALGKPGPESLLLYSEANTAAYSGQLKKAREFSRQAVTSAERAGERDRAAGAEATAALSEALFGNAAEARQHAAAATAESTGQDVQYAAALALALAGDSSKAQKIAEGLAKRFPEDTIVQFDYLPTIHAQLALNRKDAAKAAEALQAAASYELGVAGSTTFSTNLYPVYVRGEAYLAENQGAAASVEFQKIIDCPGVVISEPIGALAHLGLAHAYTLERDTAKAKTAYQDFLTLWKDADPDMPILKEAKAEYEKLQ